MMDEVNALKKQYEAEVPKLPHQKGVTDKIILDLEESSGDGLKVDKVTVAYIIFLFYKENFITRHTLQKMIKTLSDRVTKVETLLEWLVLEAAKA